MHGNLTPEQILEYQQRGFLCPVPVLDEDNSARLRSDLEQIEQGQGHVMDRLQCNKSYLLFDWADELVHHPVILDAVESLIGPDILCYMSNLFIKEPGTGSYVSMHQDAAYWGVEADDVVTAWIALSDASPESGVMKVEPGSHTSIRKQNNTYAKDNLLSRGQEIAAADLEPEKQVYMSLKPGQMSLHHFKLVHGSDPNSSNDRRIGLAVRYVAAGGKKVGRRESAMLVRGKDQGNFDLEQRITGMSESARKKQHARSLRRQIHNLFEPSEDAGIVERLRLIVTKYLGLTLSHIQEMRA